ncbi:MAG: bacillithiol biosynthesis cysteine-adding enzyme BshC [Longimicrobiales bacterium]|nr:bacillithiol biosynthesis cysteine-adding enzyme BshC [Longimicrobiales bacterium]
MRRPGGNALVQAVLAGDAQACAFYAHRWQDPDAYRSRAWELAERHGDTGWTEAVRAPSERARERLEAVRREGGFVVTTGQQPGLFTGPLYALHKALSAVRLAEALEGVVGRPVAPLFWVASEDHDWAESNHAWIVGVDNELHRLALPEREGAGQRPLHRLPVGDDLPPLLDRLEALLPDTPLAAEAVALFRDAYGGGADVTLPGGFQRAMERLLEPFGVLFVQAHDPVLKARARDLLEASVTEAAALEHALTARSAEMEAAGYPVQVPILEEGVNLFLEGPAGRERLYRDGAGYRLRHSGVQLSREEVLARVRTEPDAASPNVLLRPVVEAHVFPTLSYVAGPGELAYFAQLHPLFRALEVGMPVIHPRFGATVVERKIRKVLDKFQVAEGELFRPFHELASEIARDEVPEAVRRALGEIRGALGRGSGALVQAVREIDPTLKGPVQHARGVAMDAFDDAEKKILQAVKRENETALNQLEKARLHLAPEGKPQERVLTPAYYLARYGTGWIAEVARAMEVALPPPSDVE